MAPAARPLTRPLAKLPDDGLLQCERDDARWYVRVDGAFFHAHGDAPFPAMPARCFDGEQLLRLRQMLHRANLSRLARFREELEPDQETVECWSVPGATVVVHEHEYMPVAISMLRGVVDRLVAESRVTWS